LYILPNPGEINHSSSHATNQAKGALENGKNRAKSLRENVIGGLTTARSMINLWGDEGSCAKFTVWSSRGHTAC
jgi:hypothetical protein